MEKCDLEEFKLLYNQLTLKELSLKFNLTIHQSLI